MLSIQDLEFIVALARNTSLAAAARELGVSPPAVSQRLAALEEKLALRLVERTGKAGVLLTSDGELLADRAINILGDMAHLTDEMRDRQKKLVGRIRVLAPVGFGRHYIAPAIAEFRRTNPDVSLELTLTNELRHLPDNSWDMIIRVAPLLDSSLIAVQLAPNSRMLCATPEWLKTNGPINKPEDLVDHCCISIREDGNDESLWSFTGGSENRTLNVRVQSWLSTNDGEVAKAWALAGLGIVQRSEWDVADDLKSGELVQILPEWQMPEAPVVALLSSRSHRARRIQSLLDHLKSTFKTIPWR